MSAVEYFQAGMKKPSGRGMAKKSVALIARAATWLEGAHPTTVRGVCYRLFSDGLIPSMAKKHTDAVSRLLRIARETGVIPWEWIVDETRELEQVASWRDPAAYVSAVRRSYRRDFWAHQPHRVEVWSEKGTVRGVIAPITDEYGLGFRALHGFSSATVAHDIASDTDERRLIALYVGDWDPSGLFMSEQDLPSRIERYGGDRVVVQRIALHRSDTTGLPPFAAATKSGDPRYRWFVDRYGHECWELDAMDPNALRARVEENVRDLIEPEAWARCQLAQEAEQSSLVHLLDSWTAA
jgi:hypothetical protein